jgi:hypothetical protein
VFFVYGNAEVLGDDPTSAYEVAVPPAYGHSVQFQTLFQFSNSPETHRDSFRQNQNRERSDQLYAQLAQICRKMRLTSGDYKC